MADIIGKDSAMTAKILQFVNSAFFGIPRRIDTPAQAVAMLGFDIVKALVLSAHVFSSFKSIPGGKFSIDRFHEHSLVAAIFAKEIALAETGDRKIGDRAFLVGILHDIGLLIMAANMPGKVERVLARHNEDGITVYEAELMEYKASHAEIGAYLLSLWGFSDDILEAVNYHHRPWEVETERFSLVIAIYAANALADELNSNINDLKKEQLDLEYLASLKLKGGPEDWAERCRKITERNTGGDE